jgi:putative restriction endonuclease
MTKPDQVWHRLRNLNVWKREGQRAPHKPLLILLALSRLTRGLPRLSTFAELEQPLTQLLIRFGPPRRSQHPEYPFWRLQSDGLWEVVNAGNLRLRKGNTDPLKRELVDNAIEGGLPRDIYRLLKRNPKLVQEVAHSLAEAHFPQSVCDDILSELNLSDVIPATRCRDAAFRSAVIQAYEHRCAVCGYDTRFGQSDLGLEAAHIKWFQAGGPDTVENGLALCSLHHKAFDRGAIGVDCDLTIIISADVYGQESAQKWFFAFNGTRLRAPQNTGLEPASVYLEWHIREVFRAPARG